MQSQVGNLWTQAVTLSLAQKAVWIPSRKLGPTRLHADHVIFSTKDSQTVSSYIDDLNIVALKVTGSVTRVED